MTLFGSLMVVAFLGVNPLDGAALNQPAPGFALKNTQGITRRLSKYKGKVVLINFWASWCAPCQIELPELTRLSGEFRGKPVQVLAVNVDQNRQLAKQLLTRLGMSSSGMEILWDTQSTVVNAYNIEGMPSSFILDRHGTVRFTHVGFHSQDPAVWRDEIYRLLTKIEAK